MIWTHLLICFVSDTSPIEHAINQAAVFLEDAAKVTNFTSTVNMYLFTAIFQNSVRNIIYL